MIEQPNNFILNYLVGELDDHDISESATNPITCNPCKEITHFPNYSQLSDKYKALFE